MKRYFILIGVVALAIQAAAQQVNPELKSLVNRAFTYFPKFQELEQQILVNEQRVGIAATGNKPVIAAAAGYNYTAPVAEANFGGNKITFQPNHNYNVGLSVVQPVFDFGKTRLSVDRARLELQQSVTNRDYLQAQLAAQVATVYYSIIYLQKAIEVQDSVIKVYAANKTLQENKLRNGDALKIDVLTMQNNIDIEQNRKTDLLNSLEKQQLLLTYITGDSASALQGKFDFYTAATPIDDALNEARSGNLEYVLAKQRVRIAEADLALAKTGTKPVINLQGGTGFRNGYQPDINELRYNYTVGVGISVPIYSGGRLKKQNQVAASLVKSGELAISTLDNQYRKDIAQVLADIRSNNERLANAADQVNIAKEALRLAQSRYDNGISTNVELLNAANSLQKVELSQLQYAYQLALANIELARLKGTKYW